LFELKVTCLAKYRCFAILADAGIVQLIFFSFFQSYFFLNFSMLVNLFPIFAQIFGFVYFICFPNQFDLKFSGSPWKRLFFLKILDRTNVPWSESQRTLNYRKKKMKKSRCVLIFGVAPTWGNNIQDNSAKANQKAQCNFFRRWWSQLKSTF
jgi:hypothetical protein